MKKEETCITLANNGMHNQKAYVKMKNMLNNNKFIAPRLYHIIFTGTEISKYYQAAMKALVFELRRKNIDCEWKSCLEVEEEKGLHWHVFILVEAKYRNPCSILNHNNQSWLVAMMQQRGLTFYIAPPQSRIHRTSEGKTLNYATLAGEKLDDCLVWISYLVKRRSKCKDIEHTYFSSRNRTKHVAVMQ